VSRALIFPKMTGSEAQALAALVTQGPGHVLSALPGEQTGHLRLTPLPPGQALTHAAQTQRLHIEWAGGQLALDLAPWVLDRWLSMVLGVAEISELPEAFRPVALEHIVNWVLQSLGQGGRGAARLSTTELAAGRPAQATHAAQLELQFNDGQTLTAVVHMDSLALMLVGSLAQAQAPAVDESAFDDLPVMLQMCIGQTRLPLDQMSQLQVGGLVFMAQPYLGDGDHLLLRARTGARQYFSASARVDGLQLLIVSAPMNTHTPTPDEADDAEMSLEQMPVELSFDLGHKTITLKELRQLGEGQALPLDRPIEQGVSIRANGALIGQGQLLDIDGRIGVLISQLHAPQAPAKD
jgi:type III secretion protein Q